MCGMDKEKRAKARNIKAVLFDMDGVIIDTESIHIYGWEKALSEFGITPEESFLVSLRGANHLYQEELFFKRYGGDVNYRAVRERRRKYCEEVFQKDGIKTKKGYAELTEWLKKEGISRALCTSTEMDVVRTELPMAGVALDFDAWVTGTEPERGKPEPDVFLLAAKKLQVEPKNCLVLEDSPNGIQAGFSAGCQVIMIPDTVPENPLLRDMTLEILPSLLAVRDLLIEIKGHS